MTWDVVRSDFGGDETVNFGPRQESGTALYQIDTIATVSSTEKNVPTVPKIVTSVLGELAMVVVEQHVSIFKDMQHTYTFGYDSVLDEAEWSPDGDMLVLGSRQGKLYIIDTETMETVFALTVLPEGQKGKTFRRIAFINRCEDLYDLVIVGSSGQLIVFREVNKDLVLSDNMKELAKEKLSTVQTSEIHTEGIYDVVAWRNRIVTMGGGEVILAVWKWEDGKLVLDDEVYSFLHKDAGLLQGKVSSDGNYLFARDSNNILTLWCTHSLVILKQWEDLQMQEFQLLETREIQNHSLQDMKLVILSVQNNGHTTLLIQNLPEQEIVYRLQLHAPSTLSKCLTLQEILYLAECCPSEEDETSVSTVRFRCLTETNPETRLYRILHKNKFEEAIMFAKMYHLEVELVYKVKINFLLDQLSPWNVKKQSEDKVMDMISQLWDCLENIKDDLHVADICMRAALPSLAMSERLLSYCKQRLLKFPGTKSTDTVSKEKQQDLLTKMTEILNRLATFRIVYGFDQYSAETWDHFLKADLLQEAFVSLKHGKLHVAFTILSRHESEWENVVQPEMIEEFLSFISDSVKATEILGIIRDYIIPFVVKVAPEKLVSVTKWVMQRATNMELLEKAQWPLNAIQFLRSIYSSLQTAIAINLTEVSCYTANIVNKTILEPESVLEPMKILISNLQHLHDLHTKYKCNLCFGQFLQETTESVTFRMLDKVVAIELMQKTLDRQIKPYIREHNLKEDQIFSKYVKDYLERTGGITSYFGEAPWEAKVIAVIGCISNVQQKCEAILETMKLAPVPWSDQIEQLVQSGLQLNHPKVTELEEQYSLVNVRKLMVKYRVMGVPSIELCKKLIFFILQNDEPDCLEDALKVMDAYNFEADEELYLFRLRYLISQGKLHECMDLLKSLPREMSLTCGRRTVHFAQVLLNDPNDLDGEDSHKTKTLFTEAAIYICRYLIGVVKEHFELQDLESLLYMLQNILALQTEFRKYPTLRQYDDPRYRKETFIAYMEDFFVKRASSEGQSSYTKVYRLADILQVPHNEIQGELAIKAAGMGDIQAALKICRKLLESDPTEETAETLYYVAVAFQRRYAAVDIDSDDVNQFRELPSIIYELISQALIYCPDDMVDTYLEFSRTAYLTLVVSRQCEVGDRTMLTEDWGLYNGDSKPTIDKEWTVDNTFIEDALVMNSSIILPLVCQYSVSHPCLSDEAEVLEEGEDGTVAVSPILSMYKSLVPVIQHLQDSSHNELAYQFVLHAASTATQLILQNDMGITFIDEEISAKVLKEQQNLQQVENLSQPRIKDIAAGLMMKIFNSKNVDHKLVLTLLISRPRKESLETLMKIIKTSGHNYKKLQAVAVVGLGIGQLLKEPTVISMCEQLEINAKWGHRFSKLKINFKDAFQGPSSEKIKFLPQIAQCEAASVELVKDFCRTFNLDEDEGLMLYLDQLFSASDQTSVYTGPDDVSKTIKLSKASAAIQGIKVKDCLLEKLRMIYYKCNSYDYETLKFLLEEIQRISGQSDIEKDLKLLEYLKVYKRKCEPSEYELKYKPDGQKDDLQILMTLPPESKTRLPFHPLVDGDAWKIITQELSKDTVYAWLPIAKLLKLNSDQIYIMTITNMVKHYVDLFKKSGQGVSSGGNDKSQWNWDSKDANSQLLQDVQKLLMQVSNCEMALACAQWMVKEMPLGAEKVMGLQGCLKFAELWYKSAPEKTSAKEKAKAAYVKFVAAHQRLATEQILFVHKMVEPELMKLSGSAEKLIIKLYEHPSILQTENRLVPDIHTVAEEIASINKIKLHQIRMSLMEKWLPSASSKQTDGESTMTFNFEHLKFGEETIVESTERDDDNLTRVLYLLQRGSKEENIVFLLNFAFKQNTETDSLTTLCKVRAIRCLLKIKDEKMMQELCDKSLADLRNLLKVMTYLVDLEKLHILHSVQTFEVANKEGLIKGIWKNHSHQKTAALLVASLCLDFQIHDKQVWSSVLQQLLTFGLYQELEHVLLGLNWVPEMWLVPSFPKVWQAVLMNPLTKVVAPLSGDQVDSVVQSFNLMQRCPIPQDIDLAGLSKQFLKLEMPACALFCLELVSSGTDHKKGILSSHKMSILENSRLLLQHGAASFAMKKVEEEVFNYLLEKEEFESIVMSQFLTDFTKFAIQRKNIDGYLKFAVVHKRMKDAEKLLNVFCSYNPDTLNKLNKYINDDDEEEEFVILRGYLRMCGLNDVIEML